MPQLEGPLEEAESNECEADCATGEAACCAPTKSAAKFCRTSTYCPETSSKYRKSEGSPWIS